MNVENDMAECPKCPGILVPREGYMVCLNPYCGYRREIVKPEPSKEELLEENKRLKETLAKLLKEVSHNAHKVK